MCRVSRLRIPRVLVEGGILVRVGVMIWRVGGIPVAELDKPLLSYYLRSIN